MKVRLDVVFSVSLVAVTVLGASAQTQRSKRFSEWSVPLNVGAPINTEFDDHSPVLSKDEKTMFFSSNRPGTFGGEDVWVTRRLNKNASWQTPINLGPTINSEYMERVRTISADGQTLLFQSDRPGGEGGNDLWAIVRKNPNKDFGWREPFNLGSVVNTSANEIAGRFVDGLTGRNNKLFFSSNRADLGGLGGPDIYESDLLDDGFFTTPLNRYELNSPSTETCFWVRDDGLEIIFSSNRPNLTGDTSKFDLWVSTRSSTQESWSVPESLGPTINAEGYLDVNPSLSFDGRTMLFSSRRPGGMGTIDTHDIYMSTRRRIRADQ